MKDKDTPLKKARRRQKQAADLVKLTQSVFDSLEKIPAFTGKPKFMDKVIKAHNHASALADNLMIDAETLAQSGG